MGSGDFGWGCYAGAKPEIAARERTQIIVFFYMADLKSCVPLTVHQSHGRYRIAPFDKDQRSAPPFYPAVRLNPEYGVQ